jgi:hypothetical protein
MNSRGTGKRDDMVAQGAYPCNAQLSERDAYTIRYFRQRVQELERYVVQ